MNDLKQRAIRGGVARVCTLGATFIVRIGSVMILGRLLEPRDFGLVAMVTAIIGVFNLLKDFGLSTATVQRSHVTEAQLSALFWVNMLVGAVLALAVFAVSPLIAVFYHEPRLFPMTAVLAVGFVFNAAGVQHGALLQRHLRFTTSAVIDILALVSSSGVGVAMALRGYGYWSLVGMTLTSPLASSLGYWATARWIPGRPQRNAGIRSMLRFGGTFTLNGIIVYIAYNLEKVLLGRYWGAAAVGLYGRAYQLINIPTDSLNSAAGGVAFPALARIQEDPVRLRSYFLKGYSLVLALTLPITIFCMATADDLIAIVLGPKWNGAAPVFRLLAPTIAILALFNPLGWLMFALGMVERSLKTALVLAPLVICSYLMGLSRGPTGVAFAYSAMMVLWAVPHIAWCIHGTVISLRDIFATVSRPLFSAAAAAALPLALQFLVGPQLSPLLRLVLEGGMFAAVYLAMLLGVMGQKSLYLDLIRGFRGRASAGEQAVASA
jgi:O-antigen/teichoic acid export membrane protein